MPDLPKRPVFQRSEQPVKKSKPDPRGTVVIKVYHPDLNTGYADGNQAKDEITLENTTVGEVSAAIRQSLLGEGSASH